MAPCNGMWNVCDLNRSVSSRMVLIYIKGLNWGATLHRVEAIEIPGRSKGAGGIAKAAEGRCYLLFTEKQRQILLLQKSYW